ncbi:hypothetical protein [Amycolatopsis saalfeldensis]|uniref:DUF4878 domain-containing protein n=1 Tax=Amycolatopsis saalfeldensis TaxID=394193 RepID=A0A1H8YDB8_9PSEU|nr:hypothetical protein [Amycolatopsis saalfeldensis]SEP50234.1 hypothetical protein SAMN04489732_11452 [Amycolatopsis saalfeldensis]
MTVTLAVAAVVVWMGTVTILIARQPDPGAPSPAALRDELASALTAHDANALGDLLNYPGSGASDFADNYVAVLNDQAVHDVAVHLLPDDRSPTIAVVTGVAGRGQAFSYRLAVTAEEGRWTVAFTPPLP